MNPFFAFDPAIRKINYTTNAIESLNRVIRKSIKTRGSFPTEEAATLALRTQQVVAFETGVLDSPDPLAGSFELERMTDALEKEIWDLLNDIEKRGWPL